MLAELFSAPDIIIVVVVVFVLLFAGPKIPKLARSLGSAQGEFKKGQAESKANAAAGAADNNAKAADTPAPADSAKVEAKPEGNGTPS
jgi:sec-independent protein translocase protein TatA